MKKYNIHYILMVDQKYLYKNMEKIAFCSNLIRFSDELFFFGSQITHKRHLSIA